MTNETKQVEALFAGVHNPNSKMCVMEAAAYGRADSPPKMLGDRDLTRQDDEHPRAHVAGAGLSMARRRF
jgi:hypothetical protein